MNYLNTLYKDVTVGSLAVWHKRTKQTKWFAANDVDAAADYMITAANDDDVYFGWSVQDASATNPGGRGTSATAFVVPGIMFDADLRSEDPRVHAKNDNLPRTVDEVRALVDELGFPQPTAIRLSGNGSYFDWLFTEPFFVSSDRERERVASLSNRFHKVLIAAGKTKGWSFDNTGDLARVTRMPGTKNHKTLPPKDVAILDIGCEQRYTIEQIDAAVAALEARFSVQPRPTGNGDGKRRRSRGAGPANANDNEPRFEAVVKGCAWAAQVVENAACMPEPDWYALASIVGRCADGEAVFHEISAEDPRYDPTETQQKLDHAIKSAKPRTCANISETFEGCRNCPFNGKITSPIQLGHLSEVQAKLMQNYVYDLAAQAYIEVKTGKYLDEKQFNVKFRHETGRNTPHATLNTHGLTRKVDHSRYMPGTSNHFLRRGDEDVVNTWRYGGVQPQPGGDASIILDHLAYLFPDPKEREHFVNCLASLVQRPGDKIKHVLLIIGRQGTGKSFLMALLQRMVGQKHIKTVNSDGLCAEWTENVLDCQVLFLEELMTRGRKDVYNRMKLWVTDDMAMANQKNMKLREASTPWLVIGFSNHAVPISLEAGDRRFCVLRSDIEPRDPAYYERLFSEGLSQAGGFVDYLGKVDISAFNPSAPPPMTAAKAAIIDDARPRVEQLLRDLLDSDDLTLAKDVVAVSALRRLVQGQDHRVNVSNTQLTEALRAVGGVSLGQVRLGNGRRERLWAIRDVERWQVVTHEELRAYFGVVA